jgi:hypothetical protein
VISIGKLKLAKNGRSVVVALKCGSGSPGCAGKLELRVGSKVVGRLSYTIGASRAASATVKVSKPLKKKAKVTLKVLPGNAPAFSKPFKL